MAFDVFKNFASSSVNYVPQQSNTVIPLDQILNFAQSSSQNRDKTLTEIEENFSNVVESYDSLLGLRMDNNYQKGVVNDLKKKYAVHEDDLTLGIEDLSNTGKIAVLQKGIGALTKDARFLEVLEDQKRADELKGKVVELQGTNSALALLAKDRLIDYYDLDKKEIGSLGLSPGEFENMDIDSVIRERIDKIDKDLGLTLRPTTNGYVFVDATGSVNRDDEEVKKIIRSQIQELRKSPAFNNNLKAMIGLNSPSKDVNDPEVLDGYVDEIFDAYLNRKVTQTSLQPDRTPTPGATSTRSTENERSFVRQINNFTSRYPNIDFTDYTQDVFNYASSSFRPEPKIIEGVGMVLEFGPNEASASRVVIPFAEKAGVNSSDLQGAVQEELGLEAESGNNSTLFSNNASSKKKVTNTTPTPVSRENSDLVNSETENVTNRSGDFSINNLAFPATAAFESGSVLNPSIRSQIINPETGEQEDSWGIYQFNRDSGRLGEFIDYASENGYGRPASDSDEDIDKWFQESTQANFEGFARVQDDYVVNEVAPDIDKFLNEAGVDLDLVGSPLVADILFGSYNHGPESFKEAIKGLPKKKYTDKSEFAVDFSNQKIQSYDSVIRKHPFIEQRFLDERNAILELNNPTKDVVVPDDFIEINKYEAPVPQTNLGRSSGGKIIAPGLKSKKYGIMIHETGSSRDSTLQTFTKERSTSAHYLVTKSGEVIQLVDDDLIAHHGGGKVKHRAKYKGTQDINGNFLGIEFEAKQTDSKKGTYEEWTEAQLDAGARLLAAKMIKAGITKEDVMQRVLGQYETTVKAPGKKLPKSGVGNETTFLDGYDLNKGLDKKKWHGSARKSDGLPEKVNPLIERALAYYDGLLSTSSSSIDQDPVDLFNDINNTTGF